MNLRLPSRPDLADWTAAGLRRRRPLRGACMPPRVRIDGRELLGFHSNDYLGLAADPRPAAAAAAAARTHGCGATASALLGGHTDLHESLELALARHLGRDRALLFAAGYLANLAVVTALAGPGDEVWQDRENHASLIDAALLSGARLRRYRRSDGPRPSPSVAARLICSDAVFSMSGEVAPISTLADRAREGGAALLIDDAHGFGVNGPLGAGTVAAQGLGQADVPLVVVTFGKALGAGGAAVVGAAELIERVLQFGRSGTYTTALAPPLVAAASTGLDLVALEPWRRERLQANVRRFREQATACGLPTVEEAEGPIQPIVLGDGQRALTWSQRLVDEGFFVPAVRPPTVPRGRALLRVSLSAVHTPDDVSGLCAALALIARTEAGASARV